jgi:hypothetical protein
MSKHKSAEEKLHVSQPAKSNQRNVRAVSAQNQISPAPPKGTTANNQYR